MIRKVNSILFLLCIVNKASWGQSTQYNIPALELHALTPRGFRAELPDDPGVELFAFHGKLNDKLDGAQEGDISGDITTPTNNKWVFEDLQLELRPGDKIYYWVYVQYKRAGYSKRDLSWEVTDLVRNECSPSSTIASGINEEVCGGNLIFEENFDGTKLNQNNWIIQKYIPSISDDDHYEFVSYQNRPENIFTRNSILYLKPTPAPSRAETFGTLDLTQGCTRSTPNSCRYTQVGANILPPIVSAKVLSKLSFRYGKVEIKAKLPLGDWIYPQVELIPKDKLPSYPKILIAYTRGNLNLTLSNNEDIGNRLLFGGPANSPVEPQRSINLRSRRLLLPTSNDMRTFTVIWTPAGIDVMVDNDLYGTVLSHEYSGFNTEYQIALGVGVGGNYDFPDGIKSGNVPKPWINFAPKTMIDFYGKKNLWIGSWNGDDTALQVDSVKIWAL